jgi:formylglycine-generating enzyme required for sulfatase activity
MPTHLELPQQFGRYRILKKLGAGGMGAVYLAEDGKLGRCVALKVPHLSASDGQAIIDRFYREARIAAAVDHPHICPVHDVGEHEGVHFLVMPFIDGKPLSHLVNADHPWLPEQAAALVRKLALAVEVMHQRGLIHRDLKPANVMIRPNGEPVLMDFGLARAHDAKGQTMTPFGERLGTPAYMAPELVLGQKDIGPATDIYSLGIMLYELLTGKLPFVGSLAEIYGQILHATPLRPSAHRPGLDAGLDAICLKAMAKEPGKRFASTTQMAALLGGTEPTILPRMERVTCPQCGKRLKVPPDLKRRRVRCPCCSFSWSVAVRSADTPPSTRVEPTPSEPTRQPIRDTMSLLASLAGEFTNSIGLKLVLIPPGVFLMGSPKEEAGCLDAEEPQHEVEITRPFHIGVYQVSQEEYQRVMGQNPSWFAASGGGADKVTKSESRLHAVESVSWEDAVAFCQRLSRLEEEVEKERVYRLPTEAEWEYACRGGMSTSTPFSFGASLSSRQANFNGNYPYNAPEGRYLERTAPVGSYVANSFGLFDMHGNVWEWCADWFSETYYSQSPRQDPQGERMGTMRVLRGGSWKNKGHTCRSASRIRNVPGTRHNSYGFRVVCDVLTTP